MSDDLKISYLAGNQRLQIIAPKGPGEDLNNELRSAGNQMSRLLQESADPLDYVVLFLAIPQTIAAVMEISEIFAKFGRSAPGRHIRVKLEDGSEVDATGMPGSEIAEVIQALRGKTGEDRDTSSD